MPGTPTTQSGPGAWDHKFWPGSPFSLRFVGWPAGSLDGRTFEATVGEDTLTVDVDDDALSVDVSAVASAEWTTAGGPLNFTLKDVATSEVLLAGLWKPQSGGAPATNSTIAVYTGTVTVVVQVTDLSGAAAAVEQQLEAEVAARIAGDAGLDTRVDAIEAISIATDAELAAAVLVETNARIAADALKANAANAALTGTPTAPTAAPGTNSTQIATTAYVDAIIAAQDAMVFKGVIDCSSNPNYPAADRGHTYRVSVAGKIGGASGTNVEAGDLLICITDGSAAGTQAAVGANWGVIQTNIDGAVTGPSSVTADDIALFNGTTGKVIKGGGAALLAGTYVAKAPSIGAGVGTDLTHWEVTDPNFTGSKWRSVFSTGTFAGENDPLWMAGWNADKNLGGGDAAEPSYVMGMEANFHVTDWNGDGLPHDVFEWYINYTSPDGTTITNHRPLHTATGRDNNASHWSTVVVNIGNESSARSTFQVINGTGGGAKFVVNASQIVASVPMTAARGLIVGDGVTLADYWLALTGATGRSTGFQLGAGGVTAWQVYLAGGDTTRLYTRDLVNGRMHMTHLLGASATLARTTIGASLQVDGNLGVFGTTPTTKPTVTGSRGGNAALASALTGLATLGLLTDSTTA